MGWFDKVNVAKAFFLDSLILKLGVYHRQVGENSVCSYENSIFVEQHCGIRKVRRINRNVIRDVIDLILVLDADTGVRHQECFGSSLDVAIGVRVGEGKEASLVDEAQFPLRRLGDRTAGSTAEYPVHEVQVAIKRNGVAATANHGPQRDILGLEAGAALQGSRDRALD